MKFLKLDIKLPKKKKKSKNRKLRFEIPLDGKSVIVETDVILSHENNIRPKGKKLFEVKI